MKKSVAKVDVVGAVTAQKTRKFVNLYYQNNKFDCGTGQHRSRAKAEGAAGSNLIGIIEVTITTRLV